MRRWYWIGIDCMYWPRRAWPIRRMLYAGGLWRLCPVCRAYAAAIKELPR